MNVLIWYRLDDLPISLAMRDRTKIRGQGFFTDLGYIQKRFLAPFFLSFSFTSFNLQPCQLLPWYRKALLSLCLMPAAIIHSIITSTTTTTLSPSGRTLYHPLLLNLIPDRLHPPTITLNNNSTTVTVAMGSAMLLSLFQLHHCQRQRNTVIHRLQCRPINNNLLLLHPLVSLLQHSKTTT